MRALNAEYFADRTACMWPACRQTLTIYPKIASETISEGLKFPGKACPQPPLVCALFNTQSLSNLTTSNLVTTALLLWLYYCWNFILAWENSWGEIHAANLWRHIPPLPQNAWCVLPSCSLCYCCLSLSFSQRTSPLHNLAKIDRRVSHRHRNFLVSRPLSLLFLYSPTLQPPHTFTAVLSLLLLPPHTLTAVTITTLSCCSLPSPLALQWPEPQPCLSVDSGTPPHRESQLYSRSDKQTNVNCVAGNFWGSRFSWIAQAVLHGAG